MGSIVWGRDQAEIYDVTSAAMFAPEVLDPAVALLAVGAGPDGTAHWLPFARPLGDVDSRTVHVG